GPHTPAPAGAGAVLHPRPVVRRAVVDLPTRDRLMPMTSHEPSPPIDRTQDTLVIDPVKMNIVNRIAADTVMAGDFLFKGGLLLQGTLQGVGEIAGRLVVWRDARLV